MERYMKPERLSLDPNSEDAELNWKHWHKTFTNFLSKLKDVGNDDKLAILINYLSPDIYRHVSEAKGFDAAIETLKKLYVKPKNETFARHLLATRKQGAGENIDQFYRALLILSKDCEFKSVTAEEHCSGFVRDSFISGLTSTYIRQRLLESNSISLADALQQAKSLETAQTHATSYMINSPPDSQACAAAEPKHSTDLPAAEPVDETSCAATRASDSTFSCYFCGGKKRHKRNQCPARNATCTKCSKTGHFAKVCLSDGNKTSAASMHLGVTTVKPDCNNPSVKSAMISIEVNNMTLSALVDTGSSNSFISKATAKTLGVRIRPSRSKVSLASTATATTIGDCTVSLQHEGVTYNNFTVSVLPEVCADIILGHDFLNKHSALNMTFGGGGSNKPALKICNLAVANVPTPDLFANLTSDCKPVAVKSRRYSPPHREFIHQEVQKLVKDGIIEPSKSPWRAQVLVAGGGHSKKRLVIDYSQTINRFTHLDAYPLPNIDDMIKEVAQYEVFTCLDLKSAYHQVPIKLEERPYTAFEADGNLYQFTRIPFGVTNGVAAFQRTIDDIIRAENLNGTFAYVDNITVCGANQEEHDANLSKFRDAAKKYGLTFNESKSIISKRAISMLGYQIENHAIKPDPERLAPLRNLDVPTTKAMLQRVLGLFAYYSNWIPKYSDKIRPLTQTATFPLTEEAITAFESLKSEICKALVTAIDDKAPFVLETDASDHCIAATLNQSGRPVAFFSRTLSKHEQKHPIIEKEAYAIVEAIRKWRHYLIGRHFRLVTDQRSVYFMFNKSNHGKIKNEKIARWRVELSPFSYDIEYRAGRENVVADALSRSSTCSAAVAENKLKQIHDTLCHPGIRRMAHYVRSKNLPYSMEDIKRMTSQCRECAAVKPQFYRPPTVALIKATQPFERISIDFKGPLPSCTNNRYILTVVDEYSRFPFAFPTKNIHSSTVIECLHSLFTMFGAPAYVHSDRGQSFMSQELQNYLRGNGIATSRTTPYNPTGNGQVERYNAIVWRAVLLALKSQKLDVKHWETVLPAALHSIRSLLSTATNTTPHERFLKHPRRSMYGTSMPSWLADGNTTVLLKRHVRSSKYEPLVDEVELLEANHQYAHIRHPDGRESTVSTNHLAPAGGEEASETEFIPTPREELVPASGESTPVEPLHETQVTVPPSTTVEPELRRSQRQRRAPERYGYN
jgi:hypothetical protein